ncbi:hypothetical protein K439DRAFT_1625170 [Ramaria rubella]|nr:hypothetical protein K439DRAFT_1625170 [Ramaria rubella]
MGAQEDIQNLEWANARNREAMICHLKILHAKEEIERLNVEVKHLSTWIHDERVALDEAVESCIATQPLLAHTITELADERKCINTNLQVRLYQIYSLQGFSGDSGTGLKDGEGSGVSGTVGSGSEDGYSDEDDNLMLDEVYEGVSRLTLE